MICPQEKFFLEGFLSFEKNVHKSFEKAPRVMHEDDIVL